MTLIMGIETSCDETAIAFVKNGKQIISNIIRSQSIHQIYGGVVPELSSREHVKFIHRVYDIASKNINTKDIDYISIANGPGLIGSLMAGLMFAKGFAIAIKKAIIPVNHVISHIYAIELSNEKVKYPLIALAVSGGHTSLFIVDEKFMDIKIIGKTRDDAAGEAFDKCAKMLGLEYPGGPIIDKLSIKGNKNFHNFPVSSIKNFDFSFSGLKTSVMYYLREHTEDFIKNNMNNICASIQKAIVKQLLNKLIQASDYYNIHNIAIVGGVAANSYLRKRIVNIAMGKKINIFLPKKELCTDNAVNVAGLAYLYSHKAVKDIVNINVFAR